MPLTLDQIEDMRADLARGGNGKPPLSLQQAARNVGLTFEQCSECNGRGYTKATLLVSPAAVLALAEKFPNDLVPIQFERCRCCGGSGGWIKDTKPR